MFKYRLFTPFVALLALAVGCTVSADLSLSTLSDLLDEEQTAYIRMQESLSCYPYPDPFRHSVCWDNVDTAFQIWRESIEALADHVPNFHQSWTAATEEQKQRLKPGFDGAKDRLGMLFSRSPELRLVVEPWTIQTMNVMRGELVTAGAKLAQATNALWGTQHDNPTWPYFQFVLDIAPGNNSELGRRTWHAIRDGQDCGTDPLVPCPLANGQLVALGKDHLYLRKEGQTTSLNLGWEQAAIPAIRFERPAGKGTGPLVYGESVALSVEGLGYVKYEHQTFGVSLVSSSTPSYEWQIVPQWTGMDGRAVDVQHNFGLMNTQRSRSYLTWCQQTFGVDLGWHTNPTALTDGEYGCEG